jgi:putative nucleotidyltransferase with HDIG domain
MSSNALRVLVVDDETDYAAAVVDVLRERGLDAVATTDPQQAVGLVAEGSFGAAVIDLVLPGTSGLQLAARLRAEHPDLEVLILTGHANLDSAIEGIRHGVSDFLQKASLDHDRLERAVRGALTRSDLRRENRRLVARLRESNRLLRTLNEFGSQLAGGEHVGQILGELVRAAKALFGAEAARAVLMQRNNLGDLTVVAAAGDEAHSLLGAHFGREDGIATLVADTGIVVRTVEPQLHPSFSGRCDRLPTAWSPLLCVPLTRRGLHGSLTVAGRSAPFSEEDEQLLLSLARVGGVGVENATNHELSNNFFIHVSEILVTLVDEQDVHSSGHSRAVAALSDMVTRRLGMPDEERRIVHYAALLHDIGKLRLGPRILAQAGRLGAEEGELMRKHPVLGAEILRPISRWAGLLPIIRSHHERWDGQGYPAGLKGEEIPVGARIVGIAEAFDGMTRPLPWRRPRTVDEALAEVERCAGSQFDPAIARLFVAEVDENRHLLMVPGQVRDAGPATVRPS